MTEESTMFPMGNPFSSAYRHVEDDEIMEPLVLVDSEEKPVYAHATESRTGIELKKGIASWFTTRENM